MKIAIISPTYKDFLAFVNSHCELMGIKPDSSFTVKNGSIVFKQEGICYSWFYSLFTQQMNLKLLIKYDVIIMLNIRVDNEMEECYNFLVERNPNAEHIRTIDED